MWKIVYHKAQADNLGFMFCNSLCWIRTRWVYLVRESYNCMNITESILQNMWIHCMNNELQGADDFTITKQNTQRTCSYHIKCIVSEKLVKVLTSWMLPTFKFNYLFAYPILLLSLKNTCPRWPQGVSHCQRSGCLETRNQPKWIKSSIPANRIQF